MARDDDQESSGPSNLPVTSHSFSNEELEAVIRRAVELQATGLTRTEDGVSELEVVRIGQELGLEPAMVRRAMAEVRGRPTDESGALVTLAGSRTVRAARVLRRPAASTGLLLDRYLRETELMMPQRRFQDRTRYRRDASLAAGLTRFTRGFGRGHPLLNLKEMDVAVAALDADSCLLEVSVDMGGERAGIVAGVLGSSGALATGWAVTAWATAVANPLMLLGIPLIAGAWWGTRALYDVMRNSVQEKLESFLDRVEHGELR